MSVRTTTTDGGYFIYDSVTGIALGEIWDDGEQADRFVNYYNESYPNVDMREMQPQHLQRVRNEFMEQEQARIEKFRVNSTYGKEEQT